MTTGGIVRLARGSDAAVIAALLNAHSDALYGEGVVTDTLVTEWIESDEIYVHVAELDGDLVGYGDVIFSPDGSRADLDIREHPGRPGAGVLMLEELERFAGERGGTSARAYADAREVTYTAALGRAGYRLVRHSYRMEIELDGQLASPVWPHAVAVGAMAEGEERRVHEAHQDSFRDHWGFEEHPYERWLEEMVETERFEPELSFVARSSAEIAGVCLCAGHSSGDPTHGWVRVLGVPPQWRRRGIGRALLQHAFLEFRHRGCTRVGLGVDAESTTGALELYEQAGMHVHSRLDIFEKPVA